MADPMLFPRFAAERETKASKDKELGCTLEIEVDQARSDPVE
jgi:hypothetical protein